MRHLIDQLGEIVEGCKAKHPEKKGYGKSKERKKDSKKKRRELEKKELRQEDALDEAVQLRAINARAKRLTRDIQKLTMEAQSIVTDLYGNAGSWLPSDEEYRDELFKKAEILEKGLVKFTDLAELFGSLKLNKGSW